MSAKPEHYDELTRLISGVLDDRLDSAERVRLELLLDSDPAARRLYLQMVDQEIELECLVLPEASAARASIATIETRARCAWRRYAISAAAALITLLLVLWLRREDAGPPLRRVSTTATSWSADFEHGSLAGWTGELVATDLPPGSTRGIRAIETKLSYGTFHTIAAPEDWRAGFASLTLDSTLHVTYRLREPTWINVFCHTLGAGDGNAAMFQLVGSAFPGPAGKWQTASIPFSLFQRKVRDTAGGGLAFSGGSPVDGECVAALVFSAPHPIDFVIDRIWITPDGPASETILPTP
jgi:hypothetical protein